MSCKTCVVIAAVAVAMVVRGLVIALVIDDVVVMPVAISLLMLREILADADTTVMSNLDRLSCLAMLVAALTPALVFRLIPRPSCVLVLTFVTSSLV